MMRWLKSRTVNVQAWIETPRIEHPDDEVKGLAERLKLLSRNDSRLLTILPVIYEDIIDRLSLILGLSRDELLNSLHDEAFVKKSFGRYSSLVDSLWKGLGRDQMAKNERSRPRGLDAKSKRFDEINTLLDQVEKWEREYESSRSF
jgi:hypothetical protein